MRKYQPPEAMLVGEWMCELASSEIGGHGGDSNGILEEGRKEHVFYSRRQMFGRAGWWH